MERNMNMYVELLFKLHQIEIREEMKRIRLQEEALKGKILYDKWLALLKMWRRLFVRKVLHQLYVDGIQESV